MQVSVEKTSELSRKMIVSVPDAVLQEKMETRFKKLAREVKVDGFRPGKVPTSMVKKLYGERVKQEVAGDLIQSTYFEALQQQELVPAGHPSITPAEKSEGFEYVAEFEVYPEVSLEAVNGLEINRPTASVTDADVENMIDKLKQQKKSWAVVERASQEGDKVTIHFSGVSEGENFTDGKVENYAIEIGGKQMIPGFEDELKGLSAGESKTFSITFPEKYNSEKLAGKVAEFEIEMVKVEEPVLPELDAEFIKAYGVEDGDVDSFRTDVKDNMERELEQGLKNKLKTAVMDALFEHVQITLPNALIDQEIQALMKPYAERAGKAKLKLEDLNLPQDMFENQAKRRVALGLILGEIIQKNDIKIDADKVRATIEDMAKSYEKPEDVINWYYADNSRLNDVQQMVLEDQAVAWVIERARVVDQSVAFEDVMDRQQA
ncbi:trigger factor [Methylomonas methanica]|uniref:Trigger factor n=1 Tax=Methylomonas methanica (strain DSM 25384 / MC09) TaxID=857087 RepID=G0A270_METMM|nr:trigger factor [Methylomonas methanica]AEG02613.1 Trigger factor [Methylomonas methanica MC09]